MCSMSFLHQQTRLVDLPFEILSRIGLVLDARSLLAFTHVCRYVYWSMRNDGWERWLRAKPWWLTSIYTQNISYGYHLVSIALAGERAQERWQMRTPYAHCIHRHPSTSGPVVTFDGMFTAWTVHNKIHWTSAGFNWPVQRPRRLKQHEFLVHRADLTDLRLRQTSDQCAVVTTAAVDGMVTRWELRAVDEHLSAQLVWSVKMAQQGVQRVAERVSVPDRLLSVSHDAYLRVLDVSCQQVVAMQALPVRPWCLCWLRDDMVAVGLSHIEQPIHLYRLRPEGPVLDAMLTGHASSVYALHHHERAPQLLLSGGYEGQTRLWDLRLARQSPGVMDAGCVGVYEDPFDDHAVYCCVWDGQRIAAGSCRHGMLRIWDQRLSRRPNGLCTSVWSLRVGRYDSPVYAIGLDQSRLTAALEKEVWWLDFTASDQVIAQERLLDGSRLRERASRPKYRKRYGRR
jgi:hypothetical protein